ncbi:MAG: four helix bundle protein [Planctomycetota bacterium]
MGDVRSFRDLIAWQRGMELAEFVYAQSKSLPRHEQYGLCSQLRRAAVSVPSNIAEGWGRGESADYTRFLIIARGSAHEVSTQAELACRLKFEGRWKMAIEKSDECGRILNGLIRAIRARRERS